MVRSPYYDKHGMKKGAWSEDEDNKLRSYIERFGHFNWRQLPKLAGLSRCGKSCRLRWMNYLRPNIKHGNFTKEEEDVIVELHNKHGNKWSLIAARLSGRSDNEIKNHWHVHMRNRDPKDQTVLLDEGDASFEPDKRKECLIEKFSLKPQQEVEILLAVLSSESPSSCSIRESSSCSLSVSDYVVPSDVTPEISKPAAADFATEPFLPENNGVLFSPLVLADDLFTQTCLEDYITDEVLLW